MFSWLAPSSGYMNIVPVKGVSRIVKKIVEKFLSDEIILT